MRRTIPSPALSTADTMAGRAAEDGGGADAGAGTRTADIHDAIAACPRAGVAGLGCAVLPRLAWDVAPHLERGDPAQAAAMAVEAARAGLACHADCRAAAPVADLAEAALAAAHRQAAGPSDADPAEG